MWTQYTQNSLRHVHVFCTIPYPDSSERYGQLRLCPGCIKNALPGLPCDRLPPSPPPQEQEIVTPSSIAFLFASIGPTVENFKSLPRSSAPGGWSMNTSHDIRFGLDVTDRSMYYHYVRRIRWTTQKFMGVLYTS